VQFRPSRGYLARGLTVAKYPRTVDDVAIAAIRGMMIDAFLDRRASIFKTLCTVSVSFNSKLEAEQFYKLLVRRGRRKKSQTTKGSSSGHVRSPGPV